MDEHAWVRVRNLVVRNRVNDGRTCLGTCTKLEIDKVCEVQVKIRIL